MPEEGWYISFFAGKFILRYTIGVVLLNARNVIVITGSQGRRNLLKTRLRTFLYARERTGVYKICEKKIKKALYCRGLENGTLPRSTCCTILRNVTRILTAILLSAVQAERSRCKSGKSNVFSFCGEKIFRRNRIAPV